MGFCGFGKQEHLQRIKINLPRPAASAVGLHWPESRMGLSGDLVFTP